MIIFAEEFEKLKNAQTTFTIDNFFDHYF